MLLLKLNESTAARRRVPVVLVDGTDGVTAETGVTLSAGDMKISKNGGAEANHAGTLTELAGGDYYYEFSSGEVDTVGYLTGRIVKAGVRTFRIAAQVVAVDLYDAAGLGLSRLDAAVTTRASQTSLDAVDDFVDTEVAAIFNRIGAPVGASISADIAAVQADTDNIQTRIPAALVSGRIDASVGEMAANVLTASAINTGAITAAKFAAGAIDAAAVATDAIDGDAIAASAVTEIQAGLALSTQVDALEGDTTTLLARLTSGRATNLDNLDATITSRAAPGADMGLTAAAVDAIHDEAVDGALTHRQSIRLANAANAGKTNGFVPGSAGSGNVRDPADTKNRIAATVDANGNRTAVTTDVT